MRDAKAVGRDNGELVATYLLWRGLGFRGLQAGWLQKCLLRRRLNVFPQPQQSVPPLRLRVGIRATSDGWRRSVCGGPYAPPPPSSPPATASVAAGKRYCSSSRATVLRTTTATVRLVPVRESHTFPPPSASLLLFLSLPPLLLVLLLPLLLPLLPLSE